MQCCPSALPSGYKSGDVQSLHELPGSKGMPESGWPRLMHFSLFITDLGHMLMSAMYYVICMHIYVASQLYVHKTQLLLLGITASAISDGLTYKKSVNTLYYRQGICSLRLQQITLNHLTLPIATQRQMHWLTSTCGFTRQSGLMPLLLLLLLYISGLYLYLNRRQSFVYLFTPHDHCQA